MRGLNEQMLSIYRDFGFADVSIKFADRPNKRVGRTRCGTRRRPR